jgi:glycosyltransferase involved in cell wall biosynthesis
MSHSTLLVSVVVPAYNAQRTLDATLDSVRAQTHRALEIIVVDDGSNDHTRAIAERHAAVDARVRVIAQANAGVAAARNAGWRDARAEFVAFVDADDLWAPAKIERQLAALLAGGERTGLAYCWMARVDPEGAIIGRISGRQIAGRAFDALLRANIVGNGSAVLVRRAALLETGGFDSSLRARGGEGCEDWLFYAQVAAHWDYALVPDHLVGYRALPDNMSSNRPRMLRSHLLMAAQLAERYPDHVGALRDGVSTYGRWLLDDAQQHGDLSEWWAVCRLLLAHHPRAAMRALLVGAPARVLRRVRSVLRPTRRRPTGATRLEPRVPFLPPGSTATHE